MVPDDLATRFLRQRHQQLTRLLGDWNLAGLLVYQEDWPDAWRYHAPRRLPRRRRRRRSHG